MKENEKKKNIKDPKEMNELLMLCLCMPDLYERGM